MTSLRTLPRRIAPVFAAALKSRAGGQADVTQAFEAFAEQRRLEFQSAAEAAQNARDLGSALQGVLENAAKESPLRILFIGVGDGHVLALVQCLAGRPLQAIVVDDWRATPASEAVFLRNAARLAETQLSLRRGASTALLPMLIEEEDRFDLIITQSSLRGWGALADLCFGAALLHRKGVMLVAENREAASAGKTLIDRFHQTFATAIAHSHHGRWRKLLKTGDIPI
ncbi:MAG: hypothetical protein AB1429_05565 [Pseudomonadota bacterium]|jgi:hypothetical protein